MSIGNKGYVSLAWQRLMSWIWTERNFTADLSSTSALLKTNICALISLFLFLIPSTNRPVCLLPSFARKWAIKKRLPCCHFSIKIKQPTHNKWTMNFTNTHTKILFIAVLLYAIELFYSCAIMKFWISTAQLKK